MAGIELSRSATHDAPAVKKELRWNEAYHLLARAP